MEFVENKGGHVHSLGEARGPNSIILLRRRMLYGKNSGPSKGTRPFGLGVTRMFLDVYTASSILTPI